jgi:hypothetical protein
MLLAVKDRDPEMNENKKLIATSSSAISLSAIASFIGLCCIGPWAVALFGVSGAVVLARWQPVRPYLLGSALVMLGWAYWRIYGPPRKRLCKAGLCSRKPSIWLQSSLWLATVLLVTAFFADQLQWFLIDPTPQGIRQ